MTNVRPVTPPANGKSPKSVDSSAPPADDDMFSLDFTTPAAKAVLATPAAVTPSPASTEVPSVSKEQAPVVAETPARAAPAPATTKPQPVAAVQAKQEPVQVAQPAHKRTPLEDAALLHAAGKTEEAAAQLEAALRTGKLGQVTEGGWAMLFDLLQILGRHKAFDNLAVAFVKRFERSAPAWVEPSATMLAPALATGGSAFASLGERLEAASADLLKHLLELSESNPVVRLDLAKVQSADSAGCALLLKALLTLKKAQREYLLGGTEQFIPLLTGKIAVGQKEHEEIWLLLLELYQHAFNQDAFEETALNYAITFEMSPPSWEAGIAPVLSVPPAARPEITQDGFVYEGELLAATPTTFAPLQAYAAGRDTVVLKLENLQRIDQASCDALLHVLMPMHAAHQRILIHGASQLITTLFAMMGINRIATVEPRRL